MNPNHLLEEITWELVRRAAERGTWTFVVLALLSTFVARTFRIAVKPRREMRWSPVDLWQGIVTARA